MSNDALPNSWALLGRHWPAAVGARRVAACVGESRMLCTRKTRVDAAAFAAALLTVVEVDDVAVLAVGVAEGDGAAAIAAVAVDLVALLRVRRDRLAESVCKARVGAGRGRWEPVRVEGAAAVSRALASLTLNRDGRAVAGAVASNAAVASLPPANSQTREHMQAGTHRSGGACAGDRSPAGVARKLPPRTHAPVDQHGRRRGHSRQQRSRDDSAHAHLDCVSMLRVVACETF